MIFQDAARAAAAWLRHRILFANPTHIRLLVFAEHKLAYIPIPKAANSTMRAALLPLIGVDPGSIDRIQAFRGFDERRLRQGLRVVDNDWLLFTVVRDPFSRLASAYRNKVVQRDTLLPAFSRMGLRKGDSFERFVDVISRWPEKMLDHHVAPQTLLLSPALAHPGLRIIRVEDMETDWPPLSREIAVRSGIPLPPLERRNGGRNSGQQPPPCCARTRKLIARIYRQDFDRLGYVPPRGS